MNTLPLLFSLVWMAGCSTDDTPPVPEPQPTDAQVTPEPEPEPEPEPVVDPKDQALALLERGDLPAALAALEPLLPESSEDAELWYAIELCALGSGTPGELLDRLSVTEAIGGNDLAHHTLRATLALAAGRHTDALDAARALQPKDPVLAASLLAAAVKAGAVVPADTLDATVPADALILLVMETKPKKQAELLELTAELEGWRPALLRAELLLGLEDRQEDALAELDKVAASDDPRAALVSARHRLALLEDPTDAAALAIEASTKALAAHDAAAATDLLEQGVDLLMKLGRADEAHAAIQAQLAELPEDPGAPRLATTALAIDSLLITGEPAEGLALASATAKLEGLGEHAPVIGAGLTRAAWQLCDQEALAEAAGLLAEAQAAIPQGMADYCRGDVLAAQEKLAGAKADALLGVDTKLALAWATLGDTRSVEAAQGAFDAATALGWLPTRIEAGLALERHARIAGQPELAAQTITALADGASPALQAELYARSLALGLEATMPSSLEDEPALVTAWRGFVEAAAPGETPATGVAAWAEAHHALQAGTVNAALQAYERAFPALQVRRQGRWAPPLALDGADGPSIDQDVEATIDRVGKGGEDALLTLHEFSHFRDFQRMAASVGYDWIHGTEEAAAEAFVTAFGKERARSLLWLAGTAPFPAEAREATAKAIPELPCLAGMDKTVRVNDVRTTFADTALFSIRLGDERGELLLVTPTSTTVKRFDDADALRDQVDRYLDALNRGRAFGGGDTDPRAGDRFRHMIIDDVVGDLVGIARYLVVADPELMRLPWAVLPEQIEGRRYLADIRTVSALPYLSSHHPAASPPEGGYKPDFLGISLEETTQLENMSQTELAVTDEVTRTMLEAGLKPQSETSSIARLFGGGYSLVKQGDEATKAAFDENFGAARYVHLAGIPVAGGCGLAWKDGTTEMPLLACGETSTKLVVLSSGPSPEVQLVRAQALREAGAAGVLVAMWNPPPILRSRYLTSVYDALNRERAPARALAEARETLVNTLGADGGQADPSYWGAFLYVGAP